MSTSINTNTILLRAMLRQDQHPNVAFLGQVNGHRRVTSRLEIVSQDASGAFVWTEYHLGLATRGGRLDMSSYPRSDTELAGYVRSVGRRQVLRTGVSLTPWQEANLLYAQERLQNGRHQAPAAFNATVLVDIQERQVTRKGPKGTSVVNWIPTLLEGRDRKGNIIPSSRLGELVTALELPLSISDAALADQCGGDSANGFIPACLCAEVIPEACGVDLTDYTGWTAIQADTLPSPLLSLEAFGAREAEIAKRMDLKVHGMRTPASQEAGVPAVAFATEEAQG